MTLVLKVLFCAAVITGSLSACIKTTESNVQATPSSKTRVYGSAATQSSLHILSEMENSDRDMADNVFKNLIHLTRLHDKLIANNLEDTHNVDADVRHDKMAVSFPRQGDSTVMNPDSNTKPKQDDVEVESTLHDMLGYKCQVLHALTGIANDEKRKKVLLDVTQRFLSENQLTLDSAGLGYFRAIRMVRDGQDLKNSTMFKDTRCN